MNNPDIPISGMDCVYTTYTGEKSYTLGSWVDVTGMSVDLNYSGKKFIICSICFGSNSHANVGLRFCDENGVLPPIRAKTNNREPTHFSVEPNSSSNENHCVWTFHLVADCHGMVKLQIRVDDSGKAVINSIHDQRDAAYNHKSISTLTVLSL